MVPLLVHELYFWRLLFGLAICTFTARAQTTNIFGQSQYHPPASTLPLTNQFNHWNSFSRNLTDNELIFPTLPSTKDNSDKSSISMKTEYTEGKIAVKILRNYCDSSSRKLVPGSQIWNPLDPVDAKVQLSRLPKPTSAADMFMKRGSSPQALAGLARLGASRCAVVGNSGALTRASFGSAIDSHDVVLRLNHAPEGGRLTRYIGSKTSYRVLNLMWSRRYGSGRLRCTPMKNVCVAGGNFHRGTIISTRTLPRGCAVMQDRAEVLCQNPLVMRRARLLFYSYLDRLQVTLYGFGEDVGRTSYKFFDAGRQTVYPGHNLNAELFLAQTFQAAGKLKICQPSRTSPQHNSRCGMLGYRSGK
mmetsp:Transcript_16823/g.23238  ORF Transcript_16823/g.23238 Transcript_16823/m.23238 type:complete len:360 (-) Transcript_16823:60-1139(-)